MNIAIIGSGPTGISVCKELLKTKHNLFLLDSDTKSKFITKNLQTGKNLSPKYDNSKFINSNNKFMKYNKLKKNPNFFLTSTLIKGGLSNFWGGGIEIPNKTYIKKYNINYNDFLKVSQEVQKEFNLFSPSKDKKIISKIFKKNKFLKFAFMKLAIKKNNNLNKLNLESYLENKFIYNSSDKIDELSKYKNFNYLDDCFIEKIYKFKNKIKLNTKSSKIPKTLKFDKVIICAGTIGSPLIIARSLLLKKIKFKIYHTPMMRLVYFNFLLPFRKFYNIIKNDIFTFKSNQKLFSTRGTLVFGSEIPNKYFNVSNYNFLFSYLKKFILIGVSFINDSYSFFELNYSKKYSSINFQDNSHKMSINEFKKKFNNNFFSNLFIPIPFLNFKFFTYGSDSHYTASLINTNLINNRYELKGLKNVYVADSSIVHPGLFYPTYFSVVLSKIIAKRIFNEKI